MSDSLKNIFSVKKAVSLIIIIFAFGFIIVRQANAISITSDPVVSNLKATTATISWPTDENGDSTVYYSASAPAWQAQALGGVTYSIYSIKGLDRRNLWGLANYSGTGRIFYFNGQSWSEQYSAAGINLYSLSLIDKNHIWAVGQGGRVLFFNGTSWSIQANLNYDLIEVQAISNNDVWAVGQSATGGGLYHYDGNAWSLAESYNVYLTGLWASSDNNIWVISQFTRDILFYNGDSFSVQTTLPSNLLAIKGFDGSHIWASSQNGYLYHFDGGSWRFQQQFPGIAFFNLSVSSNSNVWAVGNFGKIINTEDGGAVWSEINSPVSSSLYSIFHFNASQVWIGGYSANIYFYGPNYSVLYNANQTVSHNVILSSLAPLTKYNYYVCSQNLAFQEVCTNDYSFTTLAACPDGTDDGQCNLSQQYCQGTTLMPLDGTKNCVNCGYTCPSTTPYCNTILQACEAKCSDGTNPGACNASRQYCDPATFLLSNNCSVNNTQCGYVCPSTDPYCNTANGICEEKCSDGTPFGQCNSTTKWYCLNGSFFPDDGPNCVECSFNCALTPEIPYCDEDDSHACIARCSDGTELSQCNAARQYCDPATLTLSSSCSVNSTRCGYACPSTTPYCNTSNGSCEAKCSDGTSINTCNASRQYCDNSFVLHTDCSTNITRCTFTCPSAAPYCDGTNCIARCSDGTQVGQCSGNLYCTSALQLEPWCNYCGNVCPSAAPYCDTATHLCDANKCVDGTALDGCNASQQYCDPVSKNLITNCNKCGYACPSTTPYCNAAGLCEAKCSDGTPFGQCNTTTKWYCQEGSFFPADGPNCYLCDYDCSLTPETPYCDEEETYACIGRCSDGTEVGGCSGLQYCNEDYQLVSDCRQCGYTCPSSTPQCAVDTGVCIADEEPPVITNINIDPSYDSAILTFDTSEPSQADIAVLLNADCTLLHSFIGVAEINTSFEVFIGSLLPSTTYYLNIGVWDTAETSNFASTGCPSSISFTTLAEPDLEPPAVRILTPTEGEEISASYNITVEASDNAGVDRVVLILDSETSPFFTWTAAPYEYLLDTTTQSPGPHIFQATAYDSAGNSTASDSVNFVIVNDVAPPVLTEINAEVSLDEVSGKRQAVITWETDEPATSRVDYVIEIGGDYDHLYGNDDECLRPEDCVKDDTLTLNHSLELKNLEANSRYHYRITSCDAKNNCAH